MAFKSTSALAPWRKTAWRLARPFVPRRARFFYEGHPALDGQLWYAERRLLYDTVRRARPATCFEIGTWKGGGSTLFIAQALHDNGAGVLHTIEVDPAFAREARENYRLHLPHLAAHLRFHVGDYREQYTAILRGLPRVDLLMLDGAEDAAETLGQFTFFEPHLQGGSVLLVHDWFTEKARLVRATIEDAPEWRVERLLVPPQSVGLAVAGRANGNPPRHMP